MTATSLFQLDVTGERLRQLLSLRIVRLDTAIEREKQLAATLREFEKKQEAIEQLQSERMAEIQAVRMIGIGQQTAMQVGGLGGYRSPLDEPASARHERNVRMLQNALAEIRWLHDEITPNYCYKLNRGDLAIFGDFNIPGGDMSLRPMGDILA